MELAARCEQASGADRDLDAAIAFAAGVYDFKLRHGFDDCRIIRGERRSETSLEVRVVGPNGGTLIYDEPYERYTASLDAAMTLVDENGCSLLGPMMHSRLWQATCGEDGEHQADAATPALALTAAALRARATGGDRGE
jgi:hypothetical protein